jgi:hypothetical protein
MVSSRRSRWKSKSAHVWVSAFPCTRYPAVCSLVSLAKPLQSHETVRIASSLRGLTVIWNCECVSSSNYSRAPYVSCM